MAVLDYDPGANSFVFNGELVTGYGDGTMISFAREVASFSKVTGSQGDTTRIRSRNKTGAFTVRLLQTSPMNDRFSEYLRLDEAGVAQKHPAQLQDLLGTTKVNAEQAWVVGWAEISFSDGEEGREWTIETGATQVNVGGSVT